MQRAISLFIAIVLILFTCGILVLASASSTKYDNASYYWMQQLKWLLFSIVAAVVAARLNYRAYRYLAIPISAVSLGLLIAVRLFFPPVKGSYRWINIAGKVSFQPSELAKIALILLIAWWLARNQRRIKEFKRGVLIPVSILGVFAVALVSEPDYGTTLLISTVVFAMLYLGGVKVLPLLGVGLCGLTAIATMIRFNPERMGRIDAFLDPQANAQDEAWQLVSSLQAFASGGQHGLWIGQGFGNSLQKYYYLPEAHTDFIFPILGEELGLMAALAVVFLFMLLFVLGLVVAFKANDDFGRFLAFGITLMISLQALINFAVVTGWAPTKGLALPFISYGGSSLLISGVMVGILVNVAHVSICEPSKASRNLFKDRAEPVTWGSADDGSV